MESILIYFLQPFTLQDHKKKERGTAKILGLVSCSVMHLFTHMFLIYNLTKKVCIISCCIKNLIIHAS